MVEAEVSQPPWPASPPSPPLVLSLYLGRFVVDREELGGADGADVDGDQLMLRSHLVGTGMWCHTTNMQKDLAAHSILDIHKPRSLCREERERKIWCDRYLLDAAAQVGVLLALGVERANNDDAASFHHLPQSEIINQQTRRMVFFIPVFDAYRRLSIPHSVHGPCAHTCAVGPR